MKKTVKEIGSMSISDLKRKPVSYLKCKIIDEVIKIFEPERTYDVYADDYLVDCIKDVVNFSPSTAAAIYCIILKQENEK